MGAELGPVLVIGGCGFLGHHIVSQLLPLGQPVSVLDLRTSHNRLASVSYYDGDISSASTVISVLHEVKPHVIIHTASPTLGPGRDDLYYKVNVDGTRNLLECAGQVGCVKAFVYTSSASVVHDAVSDLINADESYPVLKLPRQTEVYSHTKGLADDLVLASNGKYGDMLTAAIRPAGIFGEGDVQMLPNMLQAYYTGKTKFQLGNNQNLFDFTYVGNVAHAHILAAEHLVRAYPHSAAAANEERVDGQAFFVTNDSPIPFWDFPRAVWAAAGDQTRPDQVWVIPKGIGLFLATLIEWVIWLVFLGRRKPSLTRQQVKFSCMNRTYCIDKAKKRLGYRPIVEMDEGIRKSVDFYRKESTSLKKSQ